MTWQLLAIGLIFFSTCLYLWIRYLKKYAVPNPWKNLSMSVMSLVFYFILMLINHDQFGISFGYIFAIAFCALFFSYLANRFNLKSMDICPNPGYSLTFSKSYVVFTYFVSFFLFSATFSLLKAVAMLVIVISMYTISVGTLNLKKIVGLENGWKKSWIPYAIYSFFGWGLLSIGSKLLFQTGLAFNTFFFYLSVTNVILFARDILRDKEIRKHKFTVKVWGLLFILGIFNIAFNFCNFYGIKLSPNVGYINAANASSMGIITIFAALLFKDELDKRKLLGVLGSIFGIALLVLA